MDYPKLLVIYENNEISLVSTFFKSLRVNKFNLSNGKVALAPSLCGENCFRVIRDMSDCISFPDERNESLLVIFKKPIWPPSGNKNRYREYGIENLPHEAPGAPKIFRFERLNIFRWSSLNWLNCVFLLVKTVFVSKYFSFHQLIIIFKLFKFNNWISEKWITHEIVKYWIIFDSWVTHKTWVIGP